MLIMEQKHKGIFFELDYGKDLKIDLKDKKIIAVLGENCRSLTNYIGKIANLKKDSVRYRIKELIKKDIYRGSMTILNPFVLGVSINSLLIKLERVTPEKEEEIINFFSNHPFVVWVGHTQGAYDYNINIMALDAGHFDKLLKEVRTKLQGYMKDMKVLHISKMYCCNTLPITFRKDNDTEIRYDNLDTSFGALLKKVPYCSIEEEKINLDVSDFLIINAIANKADMSIQEISEATKIKPDTVKNRMTNLVKKNVILAFRGNVNVSYLKFHGHIAYFRLYPHISAEARKKFEDYFKYQDYVYFASETRGSFFDFQTYIFAKDPLDFNRIINKIRQEFSSIIEDYESVLILKDYKFTFFPEGAVSPMKKLFLNLAKHF